MNGVLMCLLVLLFSLSSPAMERNAEFWRSSLGAKGVGNPAGKLAYDAANKTWTSPGGLVW